eukprot:c29298_g1_i3 orf=333-2243(+)
MKIVPGMVALITGAGSGLGRYMALALARKGICISVVECDEPAGLATVKMVEEEHAKIQQNDAKPVALFIKCDVAKPGELVSAFLKHKQCYGRLDICINNAGIGEKEEFATDCSTDGNGLWRRVVDINLIAVIDSTRLAIQAMEEGGYAGAILNIASSAGLFPMQNGPIYSATKGGVVLFTRSLRKYAAQKIRINTICPEFLETDLTRKVDKEFIKSLGGFVPIDNFIQGVFELLEDDSKAGACLWISKQGGSKYWPHSDEKKKYLLKYSSSEKEVSYPVEATRTFVPDIPKEFQKVVVHSLNINFRIATKLVSTTLELPIKEGHVLVKYIYAGINASDINHSAGYYLGNKAYSSLPFDAGFEGVGIIVALGEGVNTTHISVGSPVAVISFGAFAEFALVPAAHVIPVPTVTPEVVAMLTSGLTALIGLEQAGRMGSGETVMVTAAAGGTGQFAVQLAKLSGNKVVATCGGAEKALILKDLGVDRVIDYKKENVSTVLKKEFPEGMDLIYESVGGEMFQTCLNGLAISGRLIIIGMMSQYANDDILSVNYPGLCGKILWKSQSLVGFLLSHYTKRWNESFQRLNKLYRQGKLKVSVDPTPFYGLESVADAVEYLRLGNDIGKVVVCIDSHASVQSRL